MFGKVLSRLLFCLALVNLFGCDISESLGRSTDTEKPYLVGYSPENVPLLGDEPLELHFSESMRIESLSISQSSLPWGEFEFSWNSSNTVLTLTPNEFWPGGVYSVIVSGEDLSGLDMDSPGIIVFRTNLTFSQSQESDLSLSKAFGYQSVLGNQLLDNTGLWLTSFEGNKIHYYSELPDDDKVSTTVVADVKHTEDPSESTSLQNPLSPYSYKEKLIVTNQSANQVVIFESHPKTDQENLGYLVGSGFAACEIGSFDKPSMALAQRDQFFVVDTDNNRILIWNSVPSEGSTPDLVLGQSTFDICASNDDDQNGVQDTLPTSRTLNKPTAVWTDGAKLLVLDSGNNRLLVWNQIPDENFIEADLVLGQKDFVSNVIPTSEEVNESSLSSPIYGLTSNGRQIYLADSNANRVLIWNEWPSENYQSADQVIGQPNFYNNVENDDDQDGAADLIPSARVLNFPTGVNLYGGNLVITDSNNRRVLVFRG